MKNIKHFADTASMRVDKTYERAPFYAILPFYRAIAVLSSHTKCLPTKAMRCQEFIYEVHEAYRHLGFITTGYASDRHHFDDRRSFDDSRHFLGRDYCNRECRFSMPQQGRRREHALGASALILAIATPDYRRAPLTPTASLTTKQIKFPLSFHTLVMAAITFGIFRFRLFRWLEKMHDISFCSISRVEDELALFQPKRAAKPVWYAAKIAEYWWARWRFSDLLSGSHARTVSRPLLRAHAGTAHYIRRHYYNMLHITFYYI